MSPQSIPTDPAAAPSTVAELLEQRARVLEWLASLETRRTDAKERVVTRIRADYEARLQATVELLSGHLESLRAELARARTGHRSAEERHEQALDALEEMRLRHLIGELDGTQWEQRRPELEGAVTEAESASAASRAEVERLEEVLAQIEAGVGGERDGGGEPPAQAARPAPPHVEAVRNGRLALVAPAQNSEDTLPESGSEQDLAFLEELDRAIAGSPEGAAPDVEEPRVDARPRRGVKCSDCGYTNDLDAWYCGVCGVDLA